MAKDKELTNLEELEVGLNTWKNSIPRDQNRIEEVLSLLSLFWNKNPDLRLGQIVENISSRSGKHTFYMEDSVLLEWLKKDLN